MSPVHLVSSFLCLQMSPFLHSPVRHVSILPCLQYAMHQACRILNQIFAMVVSSLLCTRLAICFTMSLQLLSPVCYAPGLQYVLLCLCNCSLQFAMLQACYMFSAIANSLLRTRLATSATLNACPRLRLLSQVHCTPGLLFIGLTMPSAVVSIVGYAPVAKPAVCSLQFACLLFLILSLRRQLAVRGPPCPVSDVCMCGWSV